LFGEIVIILHKMDPQLLKILIFTNQQLTLFDTSPLHTRKLLMLSTKFANTCITLKSIIGKLSNGF